MSEVVGTASHYAQFVKLARLRIEQLGITYDTVDALCGFPARYTATLLCEGKSMSVYSFFTICGALALSLMFQHDPEQYANLTEREDWIKFKRRGARYRPMLAKGHVLNVAFKLYPDLLRKAAVKGGRMRAEKLGKRRRRQIARRAAQIRWANEQQKRFRAGLGDGRNPYCQSQ